MEKMNFEALASKYGLTVDFVKELHDKVVDKENFVRAVRMFANGMLPYDVATGKEPINVAELRHQVAKNMWDFRKNKASKMQEAMEYLDVTWENSPIELVTKQTTILNNRPYVAHKKGDE